MIPPLCKPHFRKVAYDYCAGTARTVLRARLCRLHLDQRQDVLLECHLVHNLTGTGCWVLAILSCEIPCEAVAVVDRGVDDRLRFIDRQTYMKTA